MLSVDDGHAEPAWLGLLVAALRYAPHVPLDDEHGASCVRVMMLPAHRFNVVKYHRVMIPVVAQVHLVMMVPGQRGWVMLESQERLWASPVEHVNSYIIF